MFKSSIAAVLIAFASTTLCFAQSKPAEPQPLPGAKPISLQLVAASPEEAFAELAKQADVQIKPMRPDLWTKADPVELKIENGRFWPVFMDMCQQANVRYNPFSSGSDPRAVQLFSADQGPETITKYPRSEAQGCIVVLMSANRNYAISFANPTQTVNGVGIQAMFLADPGVDLGSSLQAVVMEAVDENGMSLVLPGNQQMSYGGQSRSLIRNVPMNLAYPANAGKKLVRLKAEIRANIITRTDTLTIDSPMDAEPQKKEMAAWSVEFKSAKTVGNMIEVQVAISGKQTAQGMDRKNMWNLLPSMELVDSQGTHYTQIGLGGMGGTPDSMTFTTRFGSPMPGQPLGKPAKLIWTLPVETKEIRLPFEFKDLPIP